jgi:DNA-binding LytR/AlgR family response regulator
MRSGPAAKKICTRNSIRFYSFNGMIRAIAIDDEPIALEVIRQHCRAIPFIQLDADFTDPLAAMAWIKDKPVDLLFLDIRMPDISGLDLLKQMESFELDAVDYLLKPFSAERFLKACQKAKDLLGFRSAAMQDAHIFVKTGYEQVKILLEEIWYVQSAGNYVQFVLGNQKIMTRLTMAETAALLPPADFIRIHRQYIVGRKHINRMDKATVYCHDVPLPVGAGYAMGSR